MVILGSQYAGQMKKSLFILAVTATTAYAQNTTEKDRSPGMDADDLEQRDGCYWECEEVNIPN